MTSGSKSSTNYSVQDVVGGTGGGLFNSQGYSIQTGFHYLTGIDLFRFSLSTTQVEFGRLSPYQPITKQVQAIVDNGLASGYQVFAGEINVLQTDGKAIIPNTICDTKSEPCTPTNAMPWKNNDTTGFGYGMVGKTVSKDFIDSSYFRPFANLSENEDPKVIMSSQLPKTKDQATINFKVNIDRTQPVGSYKNKIIFTAIPGY